MLKVKAIKCKLCGDTIYSRAPHDFHYCSCKSVAIDGGLLENEVRITWNSDKISTPTIIEVEIGTTKKELYDDWNYRIDRFGTIKDGK